MKLKNNQHKLSIIIPFYNEESSLSPLYKKLISNITNLQNEHFLSNYEIIFVNDGSTDNSAKKVEKIIISDENVKLINLRRNFGKSKALQIAFEHAEGDLIITMDADLQDDPDEIRHFVEKIDQGYDLVSGWKVKRLDPLEKKLPSKLFNYITSKFSGIKIHDFNCGFKAYRREVIKSINIYGEFHRYIPVLAARNGFKISLYL